ncbi:YjiH family protein [Mobilicoccus massiliensis]|uniref:YjiH family protein n=1 Tax=Mobilicoccus massiliensis TaxID=1522310 RepID=UPI00058EF785|nr:YjiH family protein [Mobilicoccus massiliensis]
MSSTAPPPQHAARPDGTPATTGSDLARFVVYSAIGIFMFFVPITIAGKSTIPLDHIVTWLRDVARPAMPWYALLVVLVGTVMPFVTGRWRTSPVRTAFAFLNILGLVVGVLLVLHKGPAWLLEKDMGPFLFNSLVIPVGLIVPIGAIFLALLVGYGLMEFIGVFMQPVMRPLWRTPGRSAIDAVASFVGSYSLALLITNRVYRDGRYTAREAAIIATGFSTVSASFMVIVAKALDIMDHWLFYFWVSLVVTFIVSAITTRIPPLSRVPDEYYPGSTPQPEERVTGSRFRRAWDEAREALHAAPSLGRNIYDNLVDGFRMAMAILPSILSIGLIGLALARFTPVFEWIGWIFRPFMMLVRLPEPALASTAAATGIAEMFLPATIVAGQTDLVLRMVTAIICVSAIIFFSAMVPTILATDIPVSIWQLVVIWFERVVLTILIATPICHLLL